MACALLGEHFDIHGGGQDLQFPHHENEIAQSEGASGEPFANFWMHNGLLNVDNEKMSKSLGNFFTIRDVLASATTARRCAFFMLRTHYRSRFNFSDGRLDDARARAAPALHRARRGHAGRTGDSTGASRMPRRFRAAMNDDFNTPSAFGGAVRARRRGQPHVGRPHAS